MFDVEEAMNSKKFGKKSTKSRKGILKAGSVEKAKTLRMGIPDNHNETLVLNS
jgi:hypothetical protein